MLNECKGEDEKVFLQDMLRQAEEDPCLEVIDIASTPGCGVGDNFMSAVTRLEVKVETVKRLSTKKCFLMKRQLANQEKREAFRCDPAFQNEANAYQRVLPALEKFTNSRLPFPECVHATNEVVILYDLKQSGFKMANRIKGLNFLQASLALKELGRFHGASLAMKFNAPTTFNKLKSVVQEFVFVPSSAPIFGGILENSLNVALIGLKVHCENKLNDLAPIIAKLEALKGSLFRRMFEIVCPMEPFGVICHGDFYINNMMFRENEMGIPEEVSFVDLQAARYASFATDLLYFCCSSLEIGLLATHHEEILQIYYTSLHDEVSRVSPNECNISFEELKEEIKRNALFGLILGFVLLPAVTAKPGAIDLDREGMPTLEETLKFLSPDYFKRLEDLVLTFDKIGYI